MSKVNDHYPFLTLYVPGLLRKLSVVLPISAVMTYPLLWAAKVLTPEEENHAAIHAAQQVELAVWFSMAVLLIAGTTGNADILYYGILWAWFPLVGPFYLIYSALWIYYRIRLKQGALAYASLPFEREAYLSQADENYLDDRLPFAWIRHFGEDV